MGRRSSRPRLHRSRLRRPRLLLPPLAALLAGCALAPPGAASRAEAAAAPAPSLAAAPAPDRPGAPDAPLTDPLTCLARTVYFETRGRGEREQTAVAWVVLNRVRDEGFPDGVCAVIKQGGPARPCQFGWWCDGRPDVARDAREYAQALQVATRVLAGEAPDPTGGANMFHIRTVRPDWTRRATLKAKIGAHWFWRVDA